MEEELIWFRFWTEYGPLNKRMPANTKIGDTFVEVLNDNRGTITYRVHEDFGMDKGMRSFFLQQVDTKPPFKRSEP